MPKYQASYTINAYEISFGSERVYELKKEHRFDALNDDEAKKIATMQKIDIGRGLFDPTVTLDSLLEIKEVKLE